MSYKNILNHFSDIINDMISGPKDLFILTLMILNTVSNENENNCTFRVAMSELQLRMILFVWLKLRSEYIYSPDIL